MPVDKFGRMSDTKTKDTGVSLTYINNNCIRSDGGTPVSGSINMYGNTLFNLPNPENIHDATTKKYVDNLIAENVGKGNISGGGSPFFKENDNFKANHRIDMRFKKLLNLSTPSEPSDAATKKYVDNIKSVLNESINNLLQLYNDLGKTQEENKEKIGKTQEEVNETRQEINKIQEEINEKIDNALCDVPDPVNPQNVATKEYVDKISSLLNASIIKLSQLYITLSGSQDENKEEIKKNNEKIKETRQEINEKINETQREFNQRLDDLFSLVKGKGGIKGDLKKDEYQFRYSPHYGDVRIEWYKMPYNGKIENIVLKTPYNYNKHYRDLDHIAKSDDYTIIIRPFLQIQVGTAYGISVVKTYMCNLFYAKKNNVDPIWDEVKQIIIFDNIQEHHELDRSIFLHKGNEIGIRTVLPYPKAYEFLKK